MARMVEGFEGHAGGHGAIANDGDVVMVFVLHATGDHHAQGCTD
jgi:hypothetical protein